MPAQCNTKPLEFEPHQRRRVAADFDGGPFTSALPPVARQYNQQTCGLHRPTGPLRQWQLHAGKGRTHLPVRVAKWREGKDFGNFL